MDSNLKIHVFILILKTIFDDEEIDDIGEDKIVSFYHFLLDNLEIESSSIPANSNSDDDFMLFESVIYFLSNFDILNISWSEHAVLDYLKDYSGLTFNQFSKSLSMLRSVYLFIKLDFGQVDS